MIMQPDWKEAPEWAQYLAQHEEGGWEWYEVRPFPCGIGNLSGFWSVNIGRRERVHSDKQHAWEASLTERPTVGPISDPPIKMVCPVCQGRGDLMIASAGNACEPAEDAAWPTQKQLNPAQ